MADWNHWTGVARIYKGYFQIYDGNTPYVYQQPIEMHEEVNVNASPHYDTNGKKKLAAAGFDSKYTVRVVETADLYDDSTNPTDTKTVSYFIDKMFENVLPDVEFEGVSKSDASSNNVLRRRFKGSIIGTSLERNASTGVLEREIMMEMTEVSAYRRSSA